MSGNNKEDAISPFGCLFPVILVVLVTLVHNYFWGY